MVQAIIFDCFGVLTTEGWIAFKNQAFGAEPDKFQRAGELSRMLDAGLISYQESLQQIANLANITPKQLDKILKDVVKNQPLLNYIQTALKPDYKIGLLSNVGDNWLYSIFNKADLALFDAISLSHETGVIKPDEQAYELIAHKLDTEVGNCLFIDDVNRNVAGARRAGMQAFVYQDFNQFQQQMADFV